MEEENININYISGASSGSIVALLYAIGYDCNEILEIFKKYSKKIKYIDFKNIFKLLYGVIFKGEIIINGLNSGKKLEKIIKQYCENKKISNINQINFPLLIPAIDIHTGEVLFFTNKKNYIKNDNIKFINNTNISKIVRASCSYPLVFSPCKYNNTELIDGGIAENILWKGLKQIGADKVISVIFNEKNTKKCCSNIIEVISNSLDIMSKELLKYEIIGTDFLIEIETEEIGLLDMSKIDYMFDLGYKTAKRQIKMLKLNNNI